MRLSRHSHARKFDGVSSDLFVKFFLSKTHLSVVFCRASDQSPATVVSASSPEVDIGDHIKVKREGLPGLRLISMDEGMSREERERECKSPEIPVCCPVPVKGEYMYVLAQGMERLLWCKFHKIFLESRTEHRNYRSDTCTRFWQCAHAEGIGKNTC